MDFEQFRKRIGLKIKYYRNLRDYTQANLGEMVKCDETYISQIENGHKNISLKMVHKIAEALNVNTAKLFDVED